MQIKSYNVILTKKEIVNLYKLLGNMADKEFENKNITPSGRECLRDMYSVLCNLFLSIDAAEEDEQC